MKHTQEEILKALNVIKETCEYTDDKGIIDCTKCPFGDSDGHCVIIQQIPNSWNIKEGEPWRAFK